VFNPSADSFEALQSGRHHHAIKKELRRDDLKVWAVSAVAFLQVFLFCSHWFLYHTMAAFWPPFAPLSAEGSVYLRGALYLLSASFIIAALLGFRFYNGLVAFLYKFAASWMGILNFLFWAACVCWLADFVARLIAQDRALSARPWIGAVLFATAILISIYGFINARLIRERRFMVTLPNLPPQWKGRTALLVSDLHLGNINSIGFSRRIAAIARRLDPSIIFIAGDLYDGSKADPTRIAAPLFELTPQFGTYFCGGNHEDFGDAAEYSAAITRGGIRVLHNERVDVDGLQVIGVSYADSTYPAHLRAFLEPLHLAKGPASILLNHVPHRLPIAEQSGVSLQLSGHTHGGQIFPFTLIVRWVYGQFTYGLRRFGNLQVLTSSGAGTWGPPMRVGTAPEVVLITLA
jgi:predicted MPP superfamily phosphohydrolase